MVTPEMRRRILLEKRRLRLEADGGKDARYVYFLIEPKVNAIRYVGVAQCVGSRFGSHISQCKKGRTPVALWVRSLVEANELPRCVTAASVNVFGDFFSRWLWVDFAVRALERAIVVRSTHGRLPSNITAERWGGYTVDLLNVEYLRKPANN